MSSAQKDTKEKELFEENEMNANQFDSSDTNKDERCKHGNQKYNYVGTLLCDQCIKELQVQHMALVAALEMLIYYPHDPASWWQARQAIASAEVKK